MKRALATQAEHQSTLRKAYIVMICLGIIVTVFGLVLVAQIPSPWATVVAALVGGAISFLASMLVQFFASREQTDMIRAVTLDAEGILPLPHAFHRLKWLAYATKRAASDGQKTTEWRMTPLLKAGGSGPRFVTYSLEAINLVGEMVTYTATFVGLQGCVLSAVTRENETSSSIVFDTAVPDAGVFFGAAYLTDWGSDRDLTLAIVGTSEAPSLGAMAPAIIAAFEKWYQGMDWSVQDAYAALPSRVMKEKAGGA
ncbi:MAG: hypothetical protein JXQ75_22125 [Phycisphaerae bacterium]|nr:hypothetical protein [Phycisphaerae bacterium]